MEFTNDIKFNRIPKVNKLLKMTYSGQLFKNNSEEVYIVYGYGENWENTSEQKMEKVDNGFITQIRMKNFDTFNFCFRNNQNVWDNNNNFNYISQILENPFYQEVNIENQNVSNDIISNDMQENVAEANQEASVFLSNNEEEEENNNNDNNIEEIFNSSEEQEKEEIPQKTNAELFDELSNLFDQVIKDIEEEKQNIEKANIYENISNDLQSDNELAESIQENNSNDISLEEQKTLQNVNSIQDDNSELNEAFSDIVKNISEIETKTNNSVDNLNYDYSDFNEMFAFAQKVPQEDSQEQNEEQQIENSEQEEQNESAQNITSNNFSDSFYDDNSSNNEFKDYFENLIQEILSTSSTSSNNVSTEESINQEENNQQQDAQNLEVSEIQNNSNQAENNDSSLQGIPSEFALYDYKQHSFFYVVKRKAKLIFSSIFSKLPNFFKREKDVDNY